MSDACDYWQDQSGGVLMSVHAHKKSEKPQQHVACEFLVGRCDKELFCAKRANESNTRHIFRCFFDASLKTVDRFHGDVSLVTVV